MATIKNMGNIRALYDALEGTIDNRGTYEEFEKRMQSEANRKVLYDKVKDDFNNLGTYDEYSARLGYGKESADTTSQQNSSAAQKREEKRPVQEITPSDAGRLNVLPDGSVAEEGFNQSTLVETDSDWHSNTEQRLAKQNEEDALDAITADMDKGQAAWLKSEYYKSKAQGKIDSINKYREEHDVDRSWGKEGIKQAKEDIKAAQKEIDNNPYYINYLNERTAQFDSQIANIDYLTNEVAKKYGQQKPLLVDPENLVPAKPSYGVEGDEKMSQLQAARNFTQQARDITAAPLRYAKGDDWLGNRWAEMVSAGKGIGDILSDRTFWDVQMTQQDNLTLLNAIKKVENATGRADELGKRAAEGDFSGILSDEEQAMLASYLELQGARAERANNTARMYNVGKGAVQTAEFMLEMALTAPIGAPIQQATTKAVGKFLFKQTAKMATDTFVEKGLKYGATKGARLIAGQAGNLLSSMVRVPFHWTTGDAISERALEVGEDGKLATPLEAYVGGFMDTYKETATEGMGKATMEAIGSAFKVTGVSNILDVVAKTKPGAFAGKVYRNFTNSKFAKATGYDGFGEEFLEEFDGAVWERLAGNPDALRDFTQVDNLLTTVGTLVPMAVIGGSTTVAQLSFAEKKMKSANELLATEMKRQGYEQDQIDYYLDVLRTATPKQMSEILSHVVTDTKLEGAYGAVKPSAAEMMSFDTQALAMYNAVKNAMVANIRYTSLNGTYQAQQDQQREDKKAELEGKYGTFYQTRTATNEKTGQTWEAPSIVETATLNDGRNVFINSAASEGGQIAATDGEGNHIFINESDIATRVDKDGNAYQLRTKQSLDGYLSYLIMQKEQAEEATRMETEVAEQTESIAAEYALGAEVTLGTPEAPIKGKVVKYLTEGNGVKIETEDGQFIEKTYEELANEKGTPIQPRTNQQIIDEEVEQLNLDEQLYAKLQDYYKSYGKFWSDPRVEEDGTTSMPFVGVVETADGKFVILSQGQNEGEIIALSQTGEKVVINEADVTKRAALPLSSFLKNEEFAPTANSAEEQVTPTAQPVAQSVNEGTNEDVVEETSEEIDEEQLPKKPDGSVDETALWNNSPAAWAKWNDQKRQDGGADSLNYINKAIERERATLAQLNEARDNETDFDKRNAIEQQMQDIRNRLATIVEVQQKYQSTQETQTQSQTQNKSDIIMAYSPEMEEKDLANFDAAYNTIYALTKSPSERARILQEYLDQISKDSTPVKVLTKENYEQVMRDAGCTDKQIDEVRMTMELLEPGQSIAGHQASGTCFIMLESTNNIDAARTTYVHERQHVLNNNDPFFVVKLANILGDKENALAVLSMLSDADTALKYSQKSISGIANEIICRAMESAYKYQNFSVDLQNKGVPEEVINLIKEIDNEQRNETDLSLSRRYDNVAEPRLNNYQENERDRGEVSRGILGEQGLGSPEVDERGDEAREVGAGVEESANVSPTEEIIKRGADFRITKTPDSNGLSYEQTDAIEKTAGELEYGDDESAATQFSIVAIAEGVGLNVVKDDGEGNVVFVAPNGKSFDANNPITAEDLKAIPDTPFGYMMADAKAIGNVSPSKEWMLWKKYALMLNAFLEKGSAKNGGIENLQGTWQFIADTVYKTVATNSDSQYSYSLDITRVCKKNEAVINAISEMQRRLGYGITPGQIMDIYLSTIEAGYQVPCPVCYVFSRYIRNGKYATIMINGQRKYGSQLVDPRTLSEEQKKERIAFWLAEKERIEKENEANKKAITKANEDITTLLKDIDELSKQITDPRSNLSEEEKAFILAKIHTLDARYRAALNVVSQSSLDSWITQFAIYQKKVDGKMQWFLYEDTFKGFPEEAALDMRMTSTAMRLYPAIQRYRNSRGSGAGKEITFVSNNDIGDVPMALGSDAATKALASPAEISDEELAEMKKTDEYADLKLGVKNLYRQAAEEKDPKKKAELLKKARERFTSASKYAKQQSLRGGQRMWSWSDNIERLAPDVFINLMQTEMLGGAVQSYSKQLEGIKLVASMNGYVNGSLMGKGNGYREVSEDEIEMVDGKAYVKDADFIIAEPGKKPIILKSPAYKHTDGKWYTLEFDDVVGIDAFGKDKNGHHFKGLFDLNAKYDKAGNILVGMNDLHIRMAMMDDRVFFIIPWHSSGANQHILAQMYDYLGVEYDVKQSQDYTDVQGEKRYKAFGEKSEEKETKDGKKKKEEVKITEHLINFWVDHYENAREVAGYGKVAGKDFDCGIEGGIENSDGNGFISASQAHYRELRDAIFNGVKVQTGVDKKGKPTYTNMNVEDAKPEWFNEIMNDEFLRQVYDKVTTALGKDGRMTSGDSKSIYPYEYWDEASTFDTADINGVRYLEYCRRLGYKPKFCGKLDGKPAKDYGNFTDDRGYWKTLIDRRMYGVDKKFQGLSPVTAENFTTDLVDPVETAKEFIVTTVADERGTQTIVDSALAMEESRGGVATVDYDLSMQEALDTYNGVDFKITEENFPETSEKVIADMQKEIKDVQFSIIGEVAALRDNTSEGVQRLNNLAVARDMESKLNPDWSTNNAEALNIKMATGWERGTDGLWRYEVADPILRNPSEWLYTRKKLTLKDIVGDSELLRLYPTLGDINIKKMTGKSNWNAAYIAGENTIELPFGTLKALIKAYENQNQDEESRQRKINSAFLTFYTDLVHEMQHAIQHREGFARGGSPETILVDSVRERLKELSEEHEQLLSVWNGLPKAQQVWSNPVASNLISKAKILVDEVKHLRRTYRIGDGGYRRLAGEVESKNVEKRIFYTLEERRQLLLSATEDVRREDQLLIFNDVLAEKNGESEGVQFSIRNDEQKEKLFDAAKEHYGVTKNFNAAGYMLPDGSLLDFSEANDGGNPNQRSLDHRDIEGIIMDEGTEYESRWMYIADFLNEGAIRVLPESAGINLSVAPTAEQRSKLFDFIYKYGGEVILEISDDRMNSVAYVEYNRGTAPARIFRDIDGYFKDGIVPQQEVQYKLLGRTGAKNLDAADKATARMDNLDVAREMESAGKDALAIKMATGWERGADNKWRYETKDFTLKPDWMNATTLADAIEDEELFVAYPKLKETKFEVYDEQNDEGGHFDKKNNIIAVTMNTDEEVRSSLAHEIQHAIQEEEGFAGGGNKSLGLLATLKEISKGLSTHYATSPLAKIDYAYKTADKVIGLLDDLNYEEDADAEQIQEWEEEVVNTLNKIQQLVPFDGGSKEFTTEDFDINETYDWVDSYQTYLINQEENVELTDEQKRAHALMDMAKDPTGYQSYKHIAGEVEARNVAERLKMTLEERRQSLAKDTEDVDRATMLFVEDALDAALGSVQFSITNNNQRIFVSNAAKAVEGIQMGKATPEQWLKMIEKNGGLKAGEDKWMGLSDWLKSSDKKTLTKEEVLAFVNENMIQIEETHYGEESFDEGMTILDEKYPGYGEAFSFDYDDDFDRSVAFVEDEETAVELYNNNHNDKIEFDEDGNLSAEDYEKLEAFGAELADIANGITTETKQIHGTRLKYTTRGLTNRHEIALTVPTIESWGAEDAVHFGDAGNGRAVAWIRFGETEGENGERILVIDEIQSKRHQDAREKGYQTKEYKEAKEVLNKARKAFDEYADSLKEKYGTNEFGGIRMDLLTEEEEQRRKELYLPLAEAQASLVFITDSGIPAAPFEKNWHELAMKRMLRYAAENGYDAIAWTKGDQQADRYALSKVVSSILYRRTEDGKKVRVGLRNGDSLLFEVDVLGKVTEVYRGGEIVEEGMSLEEIVGADQAKQIQNYEGEVDERGDYYLRGENFRIGGEGMKGFYDKMLPAFMNKYGKKWGIKVSDMQLPNLENGLTMHSIPVTEEMRQSVMEEGQVMFKIRGANESPMEFTQQAVDDFTKRFYDVAPIYVVDKFNSKAELADALEMREEDIPDEMYQNTLEGYNGAGRAFYNEEFSIIVTFAKSDYSEDIEHCLFHESIHKIDAEDISGGKKLGQWLWDNADKIQDAEIIKEAIKGVKDYTDEGRIKEMLAETLSWYMSIGETEILMSQLPAEHQRTFKLILGEIRYESREEDQLRQQPETAYTSAKNAIRKGIKEYGGGRKNAKSSELSAEERRQINEYLPGFDSEESNEVQFLISNDRARESYQNVVSAVNKSEDTKKSAAQWKESLKKDGMTDVADKTLGVSEWLDSLEEVTPDNYFVATRASFDRVRSDKKDNDEWRAMKQTLVDKGFEFKQSPMSSSEYLVNRETGEIYRYADHWFNVGGCDWSIDDATSGTYYALGRKHTYPIIGKANIADFKRMDMYGRYILEQARKAAEQIDDYWEDEVDFKVTTGTAFSGGGLVEAGLGELIDSSFAIEYDEKIAGVYRNNHGDHILVADIRDVDIKDLAKEVDGRLDYFHASPVCKRFSSINTKAGEIELDIETATATANIIREKNPRVVTIENVPRYKGSKAMKIITDALDDLGYLWDAEVYNAADFGAATSRRRLIVRATTEGLLPVVQKSNERKSWYEVSADLIDKLPDSKLPLWMVERLAKDGIDPTNIDKPLFVFDGGAPNGKARYAWADEPLPTITASGSADRIIMPDGRVKLASPRILARATGLPDSYRLLIAEVLLILSSAMVCQ